LKLLIKNATLAIRDMVKNIALFQSASQWMGLGLGHGEVFSRVLQCISRGHHSGALPPGRRSIVRYLWTKWPRQPPTGQYRNRLWLASARQRRGCRAQH